MKTPLHGGDAIIRAILREQWHLAVTQIHFIPMGDSAYSYRVETQPGNSYYLKVVDQRSATGRRTATHMDFSLPLQHLIAERHLAEVAAPLPEATIQRTLYALQGSLLFALYTFIHGDTLADAYPMSTTLVQRIGQALAALHTVQIPEALQLNLLYAFAKLNRPHCPHLERARVVYFVRCASVLPVPTAQSSS